MQNTVSERGPVGTDHERLLDVGGLRGPEMNTPRLDSPNVNALVGLVHVVTIWLAGSTSTRCCTMK